MPDRISTNLKDSDFVLAIATGFGMHLNWLNEEVKQAEKQKKPLLIIADNNIEILENLVHFRIDRMNPSKTISEFSQFLKHYGRDKESNIKLQELAARGLIRLASGSKITISLPPKFSGRPLSEYIKEGR